MSVHSAGILLYRFRGVGPEVMLVHPGGPFWSGRDEGAWSLPKGIYDENESSLQAAKRELMEETGFLAEGEFIDLGTIKQPSRKIIHIWALESDVDADQARSNKFTLEWPKKSGIMLQFPEIDRAEWFDVDTARRKIQKGQAGFIDRLLIKVAERRKYEPEMEKR